DTTDVADTADGALDSALDTADAGSELPVFVPDFPRDRLADFSPHPVIGLRISRVRVLALAGTGTTRADVERLAAANGATVVGAKADPPIYALDVPDPGDHSAVDALVAALDADPAIASACL